MAWDPIQRWTGLGLQAQAGEGGGDGGGGDGLVPASSPISAWIMVQNSAAANAADGCMWGEGGVIPW